MGTIIFEGPEPFGLIAVHAGSADATGESVELTFYVSVPDRPRGNVPIRVTLPRSVARDLSIQLRVSAMAAERNARKKS
jgi:hypothetical protein